MSAASHLPEALRPILATVDDSPDPVFITDRHNHIAAWNHSAEALLGYTAQEAVGACCAELMGGCDGWGNRYCSENCPLVGMAGRGEVVRHFDLRFMAKDRHLVLAEVVILQLTIPPPHHFYLMHILKPAAAPAAGAEPGATPRPAAQNARESPDARARRLSQREVEILGLIAAGRTTPEIADFLHISALTVRNHTQKILDKLEVHSKAEAVAFAFQKGIV
ncbi:LuxR C-terminal-related transcriptional regulator [Geothrix oryzisoli]|uniref:helix-turn-helix transcriptional regulator n=1 Tax=Geothrix oryzisoli TaxID=2922721 RepID=UPI003083F519